MFPTKRRTTSLLTLLLAVTLVAAACNDDDSEAQLDATSANNPGRAAGTVDISGSSTVAPISTRVAELFEDVNEAVDVNVDGPGTGDGFALFCEGETDISDASRPIKAEEATTCADNGIEFVELKVAIDGLSVMTNTANEAVTCLNFADMYALAGPESQGIDNWGDAEDLAGELGSSTDLPDAPLDIFGPGEESGTYDSFVEIVLEGYADERGEDGQTRPDYVSSGDDNVILQGIQGSDTSFGWVGYSYAREAQDVKLLEIAAEPGGECVGPTDETISTGEYPIARDLYIYVNTATLQENSAVEEYVDFYLSEDGMAAVSEVGYVDLAGSDLQTTREVWEAKETGSRDGG